MLMDTRSQGILVVEMPLILLFPTDIVPEVLFDHSTMDSWDEFVAKHAILDESGE